MRLVLLFVVASLVALGLQTEVLQWLPYRGLIPDLILILSVDLGLKHHGAGGVLLAFAMGFATDAMSGSHIGFNAFVMTAAYLLAFEVSRHMLIANDLIGAMLIFVLVILRTLGAFMVGSGWQGLRDVPPAILRIGLGQAAITTLLAPMIFSIMGRLKRSLGLRPVGAHE